MEASVPTVSVGQQVAYVAHACHARDKDVSGGLVFDFEHVKDGPMRHGQPSAKKGERVNLAHVGRFEKRDPITDHIETAGGHVIKPSRPTKAWLATVLAVQDDGKCDLRIDHPHGHKLEYFGVPYSDQGDLHTWHLSEGSV